MPRLFVVVPVYNEAPNIVSLFEAFKALQVELKDQFQTSFILVDDGSIDGTAVLAKEASGNLDLQVLTHSVNRGPGAAFATGFSSLIGRLSPEDWVITMEGDNTSRHELVKQMLTLREEEKLYL